MESLIKAPLPSAPISPERSIYTKQEVEESKTQQQPAPSNSLIIKAPAPATAPSNSIIDIVKAPAPSNSLAPSQTAIDMIKTVQEASNKLASQGVPPDQAKDILVSLLKDKVAQDVANTGNTLDASIEAKANDAKQQVFTKAEQDAANAKAYAEQQLKLEQQRKEALGAPKEQAKNEKEQDQAKANDAIDEKKEQDQAKANNAIDGQKEQAKSDANNALAQEKQNLDQYAEELVESLFVGSTPPSPPPSLVVPIEAALAPSPSIPWWVWVVAAVGGYLLIKK